MAEERSHTLRTFESEMLQVSPDIDGGRAERVCDSTEAMLTRTV